MIPLTDITLETVNRALEIQRHNLIATYYPETGPLRREAYPKHMACFAAGAKFRERGVIAGNRTGKTQGIGAYEVSLHLTGRYPEWWQGHRFTKPVSGWAAGDTTQTTRDILQAKLLGKMHRDPGEPITKAVGVGTGMIPADAIKSTKPKAGVPDAVEVVYVRHVSGGLSTLTFKSYEQGRQSFQGTEQDLVWLDEEPDEGIYNECLMRTMATGAFAGGIVLLTFTPLLGWSTIVDKFLDPDGSAQSGRWSIGIGWDDAPHLSEAERADMMRKYPEHERDARCKGIPRVGSGLIYPVDLEALKIPPIEIPKHWPRGYALDVGNHTAALWGALDPDTDIITIYSEYRRDGAEIGVHAAAIKARGEWIPGFIDPASEGTSQTDGHKVIELYRKQGLIVSDADNAVAAGLYEVWERMTSGRLKIVSTLVNLFGELRLYRRDEKGRIVKKNDHLCFAGDTPVLAEVDGARGWYAISDLVGKQGKVLSRSGCWAHFHAAQKIATSARVVKVRFSNGSEVTVTPDHLFLTENGWVPALDLAGRSVYDSVSQSISNSRTLGRLRSWCLQPVRSLRTAAITCAESIFSTVGMASAYIDGYGRQRTVDPCPLGMTSTMTTRTEPTTNPKISSPSRKRGTSATTLRENRASFRRVLGKLRRSGTSQMLDKSGTGRTTSNLSDCSTSRRSSTADSAESIMSGSATEGTGFARIVANRLGVVRLVWTTKNALAWCAASLLWRIGTRGRNAVRSHALVSCLTVQEQRGTQDVYCLGVPVTHSFVVAGGLVAHNCDCLRYCTRAGAARRFIVKLEKQPEQAPRFINVPKFGIGRGSGDSGWMAG